MADITAPTSVAAVFPNYPGTRIRNRIAAATIAIGQSLYSDSNGKMNLSSSAASGTKQFRGIALNAAVAGQTVAVLEEGEIDGFDLTGIAYNGLVYISDTAGSLATAAGTATVTVGRVKALPVADDVNGGLKKVLYVHAQEASNW